MKRLLGYLQFFYISASLLILVSCNRQQLLPEPDFSTPPTRIPATVTPTATPKPEPTLTAPLNPTADIFPEASEHEVCSPLEGVELIELEAMVVNPFAPPPAGRDEPHQGVDIAQRDAQTNISLEGLQVKAVLAGQVAAVIQNQFPYGNAVIIESLIQKLPEGLKDKLPAPAPTPVSRSPLTCPQIEQGHEQVPDHESLYLLYAHLKEPVDLEVDSLVSCGQALGVIGSTGNALNPHLHLEARLGPAEMRYSGLGHYDSRASPQDMANYCDWRISGWYRLVNPLFVLGINP